MPGFLWPKARVLSVNVQDGMSYAALAFRASVGRGLRLLTIIAARATAILSLPTCLFRLTLARRAETEKKIYGRRIASKRFRSNVQLGGIRPRAFVVIWLRCMCSKCVEEFWRNFAAEEREKKRQKDGLEGLLDWMLSRCTDPVFFRLFLQVGVPTIVRGASISNLAAKLFE